MYIKKKHFNNKNNWKQDKEFTSKVFHQIMFFFKHVKNMVNYKNYLI